MLQARHRTYFPQDDPPIRDTDFGFVGVDELNSPANIAPGFVAFARNKRFTNGEAETRLGIVKLPWANRVVELEGVAQPFSTVHGAGEFDDPGGLRWLIIAADGRVFRCRQNNAAAEIPLPPGETITGPVTFTQTPQGLMLFRGAVQLPLILANVGSTWMTIVINPNTVNGAGTENPTDGTVPIPASDRGEMIGNRLFLAYADGGQRDLVQVSDYLNVTRCKAQRAQARISQGTSDRLIRVVKFNDNTAICFKTGSVHVLEGIRYDLTEMRQDELTRQYGLCGAKTPVVVGSDLWFLAMKRGVVSIQQTVNNKLQGVDDPKSAPMTKTVERINWRVAATTAAATYWNNRYYLAVPLDDAVGVGANMIDGLTTDGTASATIQVVPGAEYRWDPGFPKLGQSSSLNIGSKTLFAGEDFTAAGFTVTLTTDSANTKTTGRLFRIHRDVNNAVLVYDTLRQAWAGYDQGPALMVKDWVQVPYEGATRQMFLSEDGFVNLLEEGFYDEDAVFRLHPTNLVSGLTASAATVDVAVTRGQTYRWTKGTNWGTLINGAQTLTASTDFVADTNTIRLVNPSWASQSSVDGSLKAHRYDAQVGWVRDEMVTRGYGAGALGRKRWSNLEMHSRTWWPSYRVTASAEGVTGPVQVVPVQGTTKTRNRTVYDRPFSRPRWITNNQLDDHAMAGRQDYSVALAATHVASGGIRTGIRYLVEAADVVSACSISYNGQTYTNQTTFTGAAGVTAYSVVSGTPRVYAPGSHLYLGANGVQLGLHQEQVEELAIPAAIRGRVVQLRITSEQGRIAVSGLGPSGIFASQLTQIRT